MNDSGSTQCMQCSWSIPNDVINYKEALDEHRKIHEVVPKVSRKELKRKIKNLEETVVGLQKRLDASPENQLVSSRRRQGVLESHITLLAYEATLFRKIIRECNDGITEGNSARQLFKKYFGKDIDECDVPTTPKDGAWSVPDK